MIKPLKNMLADLPDAAWIIMSIGVLILLTALGLKIMISDNVVVGTTGMTIEDLAAADDETLVKPHVIEAVREELAKPQAPEVETKLIQVQLKQSNIKQQKQQQQQQGAKQ